MSTRITLNKSVFDSTLCLTHHFKKLAFVLLTFFKCIPLIYIILARNAVFLIEKNEIRPTV